MTKRLLTLAVLSLAAAGTAFAAEGDYEVPGGGGSATAKVSGTPESVFDIARLDPRKIPEDYAVLGSATQQGAWSVLSLIVLFSGIRFVMKASAGESVEGLPSLWGLLTAGLALASYDTLFKWIFEVGFWLEYAVTGAGQLQETLSKGSTSGGGMMDVIKGVVSFATSPIQTVIITIFRVMAWALYIAFVYARFTLATILYVVGPLLIPLVVYKPLEKIANGWFVGLIQLALWLPFINLISAVFVTKASPLSDKLGVFAIVTTTPETMGLSILFLVLIVLTPIIIAKTIKGDMLGGLATAATVTAGLVATAAGAVAGSAGLAAGGKLAAGAIAKGGMLGKLGQAGKTALEGTGPATSRWGQFAFASATTMLSSLRGGVGRATTISPAAQLPAPRLRGAGGRFAKR